MSSPLYIPEILHNILQYLSKRSLRRCYYVNKLFRTISLDILSTKPKVEKGIQFSKKVENSKKLMEELDRAKELYYEFQNNTMGDDFTCLKKGITIQECIVGLPGDIDGDDWINETKKLTYYKINEHKLFSKALNGENIKYVFYGEIYNYDLIGVTVIMKMEIDEYFEPLFCHLYIGDDLSPNRWDIDNYDCIIYVKFYYSNKFEDIVDTLNDRLKRIFDTKE